MKGQRFTRTVKKKFLQIDQAGKFVKGPSGYVTFGGIGFLMAKAISDMASLRDTKLIDDEETDESNFDEIQ